MSDALKETPVTEFLALVAREWLAYGSEGVTLRAAVHEIARSHGARAEIEVQANAAVLTTDEDGRVQTVTVVSSDDVDRLDRFTKLRTVLHRATDPGADLSALAREVEAIAVSPPPYPEWARLLGIVLFTIGFSVNVQTTWDEIWIAALTGGLVALIVLAGDRIRRVSMLTPFLAAVVVSVTVALLMEELNLGGGAILYMVPALFFFIPGDVLSASMFELASGRTTAGSTQLVYSLFLLTLLFVGVMIGIALAGFDTARLFTEPLEAELPYGALWLGWLLFALGFMLAFRVEMQHLAWVVLITLVAFGGQQLGTILFGELVGTYLAAVAMIVVALWVSRDPNRPPPIVLALCGFFVLTVGALGLEGATALVSGEEIEGFTDLFKMVTLATAIALGLLTGAVAVRRSLA